MQITKLPFAKIPQLSSRDRAYADSEPNLAAFYKYPVNIEQFEQVIDDKKKDQTNRKILVEVLRDQYANMEVSHLLDQNLQKLTDPNTFTLTTAHQPSLFTGPLYYIYKIIGTINLARQLNTAYPDHHFVPVFVTGGEDHDFAEANHAHVFGKRLEWSNEEKGSVGAMDTETLIPVLTELEKVLGDSERARSVFSKIHAAYTRNQLYSAATIDLVNRLFGEYGLVVVNMNQRKLKSLFIPIIKAELIKQESYQLVNESIDQLEKLGYKGQARPREINLFYLADQIRERIVFEEGNYQVLNTQISFSEQEILEEVENHPERFSPNVVLRPLYQESVLPNLAYIGGGGELAYWLERKSQFEHFGINFPMLIRRNSVLWMDKGMARKRGKTGLSIEELFGGTEELIKAYVFQNAEQELDFSEQRKEMESVFESYRQAAAKVDPSLEGAVLSDQAKQKKLLDQLEGRLMRAEKQKQETGINQIRSIKEKLFPGNGLQERFDNFLPFYLSYGDAFFEILLENLDPLDRSFVVVEHVE